MKLLNAFALVALGACSAGSADSLVQANTACTQGASHAEVLIDGTVVRVLGVRRGRSGSHEGFLVSAASAAGGLRGPTLRVEDNIDLTGYIALSAGQHVEILGQYECDDRVVHWTHHDPSGRHPTGYVKVNGRTYQ